MKGMSSKALLSTMIKARNMTFHTTCRSAAAIEMGEKHGRCNINRDYGLKQAHAVMIWCVKCWRQIVSLCLRSSQPNSSQPNWYALRIHLLFAHTSKARVFNPDLAEHEKVHANGTVEKQRWEKSVDEHVSGAHVQPQHHGVTVRHHGRRQIHAGAGAGSGHRSGMKLSCRGMILPTGLAVSASRL